MSCISILIKVLEANKKKDYTSSLSNRLNQKTLDDSNYQKSIVVKTQTRLCDMAAKI